MGLRGERSCPSLATKPFPSIMLLLQKSGDQGNSKPIFRHVPMSCGASWVLRPGKNHLKPPRWRDPGCAGPARGVGPFPASPRSVAHAWLIGTVSLLPHITQGKSQAPCRVHQHAPLAHQALAFPEFQKNFQKLQKPEGKEHVAQPASLLLPASWFSPPSSLLPPLAPAVVWPPPNT